MRADIEVLAILLIGFTIVILGSLGVIITLWVKNKKAAYAWFLAQIVLLIFAFFMFVGLAASSIKISKSIILKDNSVALYIIGALWAGSMACMLMGIFMLTKKKRTGEELNKEKVEYNPGFIKVFGMLAFYNLVCPIIPMIILAIVSKSTDFSSDDPLYNAVVTIVALGLLILWLKRKYIINFKGMFERKDISKLMFIPMVLTIMGLGILLSEVDNFMQRILPVSDFWLKIFHSLAGKSHAPWKAILAVVVVAPLIEEIMFRGMILRGFLKHYSVKKAIILSALLFGIVHMNPWQFVSALIAGIVFGWWYVKTKSIIPTIFGHALHNGTSFIVGAIGISIPGYNAAFDTVNHQPIWFDSLGIILLAGGIVWLVKLFKGRQVSAEGAAVSAEEGNLLQIQDEV